MDTPRYRIGNDLTVLWAICNRDGSPFNLDGKRVKLFVVNERGREEVEPIITTLPDGTTNNVIRWDFKAEEQKVLGSYALSAEISITEDSKVIKKDYSEAFNLVSRSEQESEDEGDMSMTAEGDLYLTSKLDVFRFGIPKIEINTKGHWTIDGVDSGQSALGGGQGLVNKIYNESDFDKEFDNESVIDTFNASAIAKLHRQVVAGPTFSVLNPETDNIFVYRNGVWMNIPAKELVEFYAPATGGGGGFPQDMWYYGDDGRLYTTKDVVVLGNLGVGGPGLGGNGEGAQVVTALSELTDVSIYNPKAGEILVYEDGKWINKVFSVDIPVMPDLEGYATEAWVERQGYVKATDIADPLSKIETFSEWFEWADEEHTTIRTKYNFFSQKQIAVGEKGETDSPASGGGITGIQVNGNIYNDADEFGIITIPNYPTELRWESVTGRPTKLTDFENDLDLSAYAGRQYVDDTFYTKAAAIVLSQGLTASQEAINKLNVLLEWFKYDSVNDAVYTDKSFYSKLQLAAGERGENASAGGGTITGIRVNGKDYASPDEYGILTIPDYPTSLNWDDITGKPTDLGQFTNEAGYIKDNALEGYATQGWVEAKQYALASNVYDKDAINQKEKDLSDRIALFEKWFREDSAGNLYTTYNFYSTKQLATGEAGAAHEGEGGGGRVNGIIINGIEYVEVDDYGNLIVSEKLATLSDLASYLKNTEADNKFATKTYVNDTFATITSLGGVDARLKEIEEYFNGSGEDADNKINKWNEIVAFLNATEDTTLAGILAAYTLKTDHNALAERVTANKGAISGINTTLGSHTSTLSEHTTAINTLGSKVNPIDTWFNEVGKFFKKDSDGVWYVDGNFYTKGQNAAGEVGSPDGGGSSGSGVMLLESWANLPSDLSGYALSAALGIDLHERFNNYYTIGDVDSRFSGINSRLATLDSGMADRYTKAESDGRYLKLSGGTITKRTDGAALIINTPDTSWAGIRFKPSISSVGATLTYSEEGWGVSDEGWTRHFALIHSGNIGDYALKTNGSNAMLNNLPLGKYSIIYNASHDTSWTNPQNSGLRILNAVQAKPTEGVTSYAVGLSVSGYYGFQLASDGGNYALYYRGTSTGANTGYWKTIAFTDSNVASAQALQHSNGTVGATAQSSGLVSFASHIVPNNDSQAYVGVADKAWYAVYTNGLWAPSGKTLYLGANNSNHIIVNTSGNVTIGESDIAEQNYKLATDGKIYIRSPYRKDYPSLGSLSSNSDFCIEYAYSYGVYYGLNAETGNGFVQVGLNNSSKITYNYLIQPLGGNVGIGTTNPAYKLDVAGTGRFSNLLTASAGISTPHITIGGITISVVDGVLRIDGNVYTTGQLGVGAVGQEGGGTGGGGVLLLNTWPTDGGSYAGYALGGNLGIDLNTRVKTLEGKATAVSFSQTLTSGKQIGVLTIDGSSSVLYAPSTYAWSEITGRPNKLSDFTDDVVSGKYLSLSGGTISGTSVAPLIINTSASDSSVVFRINSASKTQIGYNPSLGSFIYNYSSSKSIGIKDDGTPHYNGNTLYHAGNFNPADYLPLTGGTIEGVTTFKNWLYVNALTDLGSYVRFYDKSGGFLGGVGVNSSKIPFFYDSKGISYNILTSAGGTISGNLTVDGHIIKSGHFFGVNNNDNAEWYVTDKNWQNTYTLIHSGNIGSQSVASATKLATAITIWGQSFDGTGNVSGHLTLNNQSAILSYTTSGTALELFHVSSNNNLSIGYSMAGVGGSYIYGNLIVLRYGSSRTNGLILNSSGNVTIGSTDLAGTSAKLAINGDVRIQNNTTTNGDSPKLYLSGLTASDGNVTGPSLQAINSGYYGRKRLAFFQHNADNYTTETEVFSILPNGNVGIGTANPAYRLDVAGSIRTTSSLTIGTIVLTDENGTLKIAGNAYTTGQLGAGEAGQATSGGGSVILDYDSIVDALGFTPAKQNDLTSLAGRVNALENAGPSSSSSSLYGDEITIGSSMGNIYISSENDVQIESIMGNVLVNGSEVLTKANTAFTRNYSSGTKIGTIKIGGVSTDIYVPASSSSSLWTTEYSIDVGNDVLAASKEYIGTNTIVGWDAAGSCVNDLYIGYDGYTIWMQGSVDEASDMRLKTVIDAVNLDIRDIAFAPIFNYVFKSRPQGRQMLGSSAQYWQPITPSAVSENDKGNLGMNYGAVALASVVAVAKETLTQREEIAELKSMALTQKEEIANLKLKVQSLETRLAKYELN